MKLRSIGFIIDNTQEFLSPNFHEPNMTPFRYLLFLTITIIAMGPKRLSLVELILVLCFTNMALYSVRFIPFFAIIVAPILAKHSDLIINQFGGRAFRFFKERVKNISSIDTSAKGYVWVFIMVFIVLLAAANGKIKYQFDETKAPLRAMEFLQKTGLKGNMYNDFQFGGHIIYHLYPNYKVFIDGRTELYGNERVAEYGRVAQLDPGWQKVIEKYEVNWIICVSKSRLSAMLDGNRDWHRIYRDRVASIFIRDVFDNRSLIERYG